MAMNCSYVQCGREYVRDRSTGRYCSSACRVAALRSRRRDAPSSADGPPQVSGGRLQHSLALQGPSGRVGGYNPHLVTLSHLSHGASKPLPKGIVRDAKYPNMYRLKLPDGSLSDMVNLTRAKDALRD